MGLRSLGELVGAIDSNLELSSRGPAQDIVGAPQQFQSRSGVMGKGGTGQEERSHLAQRERIDWQATGPLDWPKETIIPRGRRQMRLFMKVDLPDGIIDDIDAAACR